MLWESEFSFNEEPEKKGMADKLKMSADDHPCARCGLRSRAEAKPDSIMARLWRWHTTWCPGWKSYQNLLAKQQEISSSHLGD